MDANKNLLFCGINFLNAWLLKPEQLKKKLYYGTCGRYLLLHISKQPIVISFFGNWLNSPMS